MVDFRKFNYALSRRIGKLIKDKGFTRFDFARYVGLNKEELNDICNGKYFASLHTYILIANGLEMSVSELLNINVK